MSLTTLCPYNYHLSFQSQRDQQTTQEVVKGTNARYINELMELVHHNQHVLLLIKVQFVLKCINESECWVAKEALSCWKIDCKDAMKILHPVCPLVVLHAVKEEDQHDNADKKDDQQAYAEVICCED